MEMIGCIGASLAGFERIGFPDAVAGTAPTECYDKRIGGIRMRKLLAVGLLAMDLALGSQSPKLALTPGMYEVEVRISLPNVADTAPPMVTIRCLGANDLQSGQAFFVLSDNPLKACNLLDYRINGGEAAYRIACAGPNRGSAVGLFDTTDTSYRGTISMNMGGKNMTMSETQIGRRIGDCK
jgi:hypothetical protein